MSASGVIGDSTSLLIVLPPEHRNRDENNGSNGAVWVYN
jgi:hypothetical protein